MIDTVGGAIIELGVDSGGVESGLARVDGAVTRTARTLQSLGDQGSTALDGIAAGGATAATRMDTATRSIANSLERANAALKSGKKAGSEYLEELARLRGADLAQLAPLIAQLRETEQAQIRVTAAAEASRAAQEGAAAAAHAEAAAQREVAQAQAGRDAFLAGLREQIQLYGRSSDEILRYRAAQAGVAEGAAPLILQLQNIRAAHEQITVAARAEEQAQRQATQVQAGRDSFIAGLEQQANAIGRTRSELLELQAAQMGVSTQAAPFIARLRESEAVIGRTGISAGQLQQALRGVPAQFTDIVTSLQGGQAPLTVFLQQGGQLRDTFGSAGGALRGLAGYVVGLVNPVTVAAAALAALAVAYNQGSKEADAFNRALILTGNTAGTTAGRLADMAANISKSVGTQGVAAEALAALAGTGKVGADNLERFGAIAVKAQRSIGQSVADTAKDFAELGKSPLQASERLNEQYHYLTASVYAQIKALQDQGRAEEAGEVAQKAFADAFDTRSTKLESRLGSIERGWRGVSDFAKKAWDSMLDIGRAETLQQKLTKVQADIAKGQKPFDPAVGGNAESRMKLKDNLALEASLRNQIDAEGRLAAIDAGRQKLDEADLIWRKDGEKYLDRELQLKNAIKAAEEQGVAAGMSDLDIKKRVLAIQQNYADLYNDKIDSQIEAIKRRGAVEDAVVKRSADLLTANRAAGIVAERDYIEAVATMNLAQYAKEKSRLEDELGLVKQKQKSQEAQAALSGQIAYLDVQTLSRKLQLTNDLYVLDVKETRQAAENYAKTIEASMAERDGLIEQVRLQREQNDQIGMSAQAIGNLAAARLEDLAAQKQRMAAALADNEINSEQIRLLVEQSDALRALADSKRYAATKTFQFEEQKKLWESIDQTAHDTFVNIFENGKSAFDRLRDTLKSGLLDLLYQMTIKKWIFNIGAEVTGSSAIGALGGSQASGAGGALSAISSGASLFSVGKTIYSGFNAGLVGSLGSSISSIGGAIGSEAVTAFGLGMQGGLGGALAAAGPGATATSSAAASAGAGAAGAIPVIGWIIAGMMASKGLYAQGWDAHNGSVSQLGLAAGGRVALQSDTLLQKLGLSAVAANILSGQATIAKLFGRKNPEIESQGLRGTLTTSGTTDAENYANILQKGGWFRSDKRWQDSAPVSGQTDDVLDSTMKAVVAAVRGFGSMIGVEASKIDGYTKSFDIKLTGVEADDNAALAKLFADVSDGLSTTLVPSLSALATAGENASATLQRVATDYVTLDDTFRSIGKTFGAVGADSLSARERLIALAGGIDSLKDGAASFAQNYLSADEQLAPVAKYVKDQMAALGYASVTTADQFKNLVLGLDVTTEAGAKSYAALISINPAFKMITDAAAAREKSQRDLQGQIYDLTHSAAEALARKRQEELAAMEASLRPLQERIYALTDEKSAAETYAAAAAAAIQKAKDSAAAQQAVFADFGNALADTMTKAKAASLALREYAQSLLTGSSSPLSASVKYSLAKQELQSATPETVQEKANAFLELSKNSGEGALSYARDFAMVQSMLKAMAAAQDVRADNIAKFWRDLVASGGWAGGINGSHAAGADNIPFDGYRAELHRGEKVLTSAEANAYRKGDSKAIEENTAAIRQLQESLALIRKSTESTAETLLRVSRGGVTFVTEPA